MPQVQDCLPDLSICSPVGYHYAMTAVLVLSDDVVLSYWPGNNEHGEQDE